jgi:hypothetical protein
MCEQPSSGCRTSKRLSVLRTFTGLVYSQFELVKIELKKVNYIFFGGSL